jgi:hypothetical protein
MMIRIAKKLSSPFGRSIRGDGLDIQVLFRKGNSLVLSINRGGGSKDEVFDSMGFTGFQKNDRPADIYILVKEGIRDGRPHPSPGSQVNNGVNLVFLKNPLEVIRVSNISCDQLKQLWKLLLHALHVFDLYIGIIKAVKVV